MDFNDLMAGVSTPGITAQTLGTDTTVPLTAGKLALDLFDFQVEAVEHALRDTVLYPYGYIGLEMGLGKTPCGISIAVACKDAGIGPVLVVVPPSLRTNWQREFAKFAPSITTAVLTGSTPPEGFTIPKQVDVVILGDSSVAGWADFLTGKVGALIVDEAHRFKNKSKRSKGLAQVADSVPSVRILMSGTPMPNGRHQELATQIDLMGNGAWKDIGGKGIFWNHYCPKIDRWGGRGNKDGAELHQAMINSWFFRRLRANVIDLPSKGRASVALDGQGKYKRDYLKAEEDLISYLAGEQDGMVTEGQRRAEALIKMTTLRKLAGYAKVDAAVDHIKDILDSEPGGVFVVAEHRDVMDRLLMKLAKYNPTTVQGGMSDAEKADNVDAFNAGDSRVLVGQITAAGVGLTLHGDGKNHRVVVVQLPWTPAELKQAEDRLHRIGQTHDVMVEVGLCAIEGSWTIDERLWGMLESKNFAASTITDGEGEFLLSAVQDGLLDSYRR